MIPSAACPHAFFAFGNLLGNLTNVICKREILLAAGGFDQRLPYAGDFEMWTRATRLGALGIQREECVYVTEHEGQSSVTLNRNNELVAQVDHIMDTLHDALPVEDKALARWHSTLTVGVHHASSTLHRIREGKWGALRSLFGPRRHAYGGLACLVLYFSTGGGRWGYVSSTRAFLRRIHVITSVGAPS